MEMSKSWFMLVKYRATVKFHLLTSLKMLTCRRPATALCAAALAGAREEEGGEKKAPNGFCPSLLACFWGHLPHSAVFC